ncbi:MAG: hypothetical protein ACFFD5_03235 [Candidatus Thorarchaeota archaeon]
MRDDSEEIVLEKAALEKTAYNWKGAAELYQIAAKSFLKKGNKIKAIQTYYLSFENYIEATYSSENQEELEENGNHIISILNDIIGLYDENKNLSEILECKGIKLLFQAVLITESKEEIQRIYRKSLETLIKSYNFHDKSKNKEMLARKSYFCSMAALFLTFCIDNPRELNATIEKSINFGRKAWELSKESTNFQFLVDALDIEMLSWDVLIAINDFKLDKRWKNYLKEVISRCNESLIIIGDIKNSHILRPLYSAMGKAKFLYGFYYVEEEIEQRSYLDKGINLIEDSLKIAREIGNNFALIIDLYNLNYYALIAGKMKYLQTRISRDLEEITKKGMIFDNTNTALSARAKFAPILYYANVAQMDMFNPAQRISFAEKGIELAQKALGVNLCEYWDVLVYQELVWLYSELINLTTNKEIRAKLIKESLAYANHAKDIGKRFDGGMIRTAACSSIYRAYKTVSDFADIEEEKIKSLQTAINAAENYIKHTNESRTGKITANLRLGLLYEELGILTSKDETLNHAKNTFNKIYIECMERKYYSYAAAASEYIARVEDRLGRYTEAANHYQKAKSTYSNSMEKVEYKLLKKRIKEKMNYTEAWSLIEDAKTNHKKENHLKAKENYELAFEILKNLPNYSFESNYYIAWAIQEEAEHLSKLEKHVEAIEKYKKTKAAFNESIREMNEVSERIKDKFTKERIKKLEKVAQLRIKYCSARANIENARILGKQGEYCASAELFASAATEFRDVCSLFKNERERADLEAVYFLCRAWESMELAEKYKDPERFQEAASLFKKASEHFKDSKLKFLASGNSAFCQALELGSEFDEVDEYNLKAELYPKIRTILRKAASLYEKGGFEKGSDWALATSTYFDAGWSLIQADKKLDFEERKNLLKIGSEYLKSAALLFRNAGYEDKEREVLKRLNSVEKEEKIIFSALNSIKKPSISGSVAGIIAPTCSIETSQSPRLGEISQFTQGERRSIEERNSKKYDIIYQNFIKEPDKNQRQEVRVGIAQIGLSKSGNIMGELYHMTPSGLLGLKNDKVEEVKKNVKLMIENAHKEGVDVLIFPEMSVDLNYDEIYEDILGLAKSHEMFIIPGSFHDLTTKKNLSMVFGPEGILWEQAKHIPAMIQLGGHRFKEKIEVGHLPRKIIVSNTEFGRIVIAICRDFLDMDLRVELKNFEPPIDIIINPAFTPVTEDFKAAHFDARRSIYAYCFFANVAEFGDSLIYTPEKDRTERRIPAKQEGLIYKDINLFHLRSERKKWEKEQEKEIKFIQSTR